MLEAQASCKQCLQPYTFNMKCRICIIKHLRMIPKQHARDYLRDYKAKNGEEEMMKLIGEVKAV